MLYCWLKQKYNQFFNWFVTSEEDLHLEQKETELKKNRKILIKQKKNIKNKKRKRLNQNKIS